MNTKLINKILSEVSLDERVKDGIFKLEEEAHMTVLREYLINHGIEEAAAIEFCNRVLEGKYPERQAYNKNGILVTFPTPEYKKKAIQAGTHFEEDPTRGKSNLFQQPSGGKKDKEPEPTPPPKAGSEPKTQLPVSQAQPSDPEAKAGGATAPQPQTTAAPMSTPEPTTPKPAETEPTELPPPPPKSQAEKSADKQAIKTMLKGDDYMLEQVVDWFVNNAPEYLKEQVDNHLKRLLEKRVTIT